MIRLLLFALCFVLVVVFITRYLGPDDLSDCTVGPTNEAGCEQADVIVAVSGGDTTARTHEAIRLYEAGWAPRLVFSGAAKDKDSPSNAAVMREIAMNRGVPDSAISIDEFGETTKGNAEETADLLRSDAISSIILVTSGYHQRRASLEFEQRFESADIRRHPVSQDKQWSAWWWMTPTGWYLALGEIIRIMVFYLGVTR